MDVPRADMVLLLLSNFENSSFCTASVISMYRTCYDEMFNSVHNWHSYEICQLCLFWILICMCDIYGNLICLFK